MSDPNDSDFLTATKLRQCENRTQWPYVLAEFRHAALKPVEEERDELRLGLSYSERENARLRAQLEDERVIWKREYAVAEQAIVELAEARRLLERCRIAFGDAIVEMLNGNGEGEAVDGARACAFEVRAFLAKSTAAPVCSVCLTQAAGLPTPGYIHDEGCPLRKAAPPPVLPPPLRHEFHAAMPGSQLGIKGLCNVMITNDGTRGVSMGRFSMRVRFIFAWYDLWIGAYWDAKGRRLYILPVPCCGIVLEFA